MSDIENRPDPDFDAAFEADFADFLQGKGELSSLLQALPQPAPAQELDQKILAATRAALQREAASRAPTAANDPAPAVSPIRRWRIPLGIAASLVLTLTVTLQMQQHHADEVTVQAEMPHRPAPAAAPAAPEPTTTAAADAPVVAAPAVAPAVEPVAAPPRQAKKAAQPLNHDLAAAADDSQLLAKRQQAETAAASRANAEAAERRVAQEQVAEREKLARESRPRMAKEKLALDKTEPAATALQAKAEQMAAESAKPATEPAKPVAAAAPPPQPARMAAAGPAPAARMAPNTADSSSVTSDAGSERDYLARIEQALKQGRQRAALEEWERFRRTYPAYPVPPELQKQIDALKKASGQPAEQ